MYPSVYFHATGLLKQYLEYWIIMILNTLFQLCINHLPKAVRNATLITFHTGVGKKESTGQNELILDVLYGEYHYM